MEVIRLFCSSMDVKPRVLLNHILRYMGFYTEEITETTILICKDGWEIVSPKLHHIIYDVGRTDRALMTALVSLLAQILDRQNLPEGLLCRSAEDYRSALDIQRWAIEHKKDYFAAWYQIALCLEAQRQYKDAVLALEEVCKILNPKLALGIDVEEWYESKSGYVLIPQIDYLDNLVWLYSKIRKYRLTGLEDTLRYIEKRYDEYFRMIYLNHMSEGHLSVVSRNAIEYYNKKGIQHNYGNKQCVFSSFSSVHKLYGNPESVRSRHTVPLRTS